MDNPSLQGVTSQVTLADLDKLADDLNVGKSLVDTWLTSSVNKKLKRAAALPIDYSDTSLPMTRPARLGIGAKPQIANTSEPYESIFGNYQLKMQLTGRERLGEGKVNGKGLVPPIHQSVKKKLPPVKSLRPFNTDEEESRAKSVGIVKTAPSSTILTIPSCKNGRRKRKK